MKKTLSVLLTVLSFSSAFAQSLDQEIGRKIDRLNNASNRGDIARLSRVEKDELNSLMDRSLRVLRDDGRDGLPDDNRRPVPGPSRDDRRDDRRDERVGRHGRRDGMMLVALLENNLLVIRGAGPGEMLARCTAEVGSGRYGSVDDIVFTMNGGRYNKLRNNSSYWRGGEICTVLMVQAEIEYSRAPYITVAGNIENRGIVLEGSRGEILEACVESTRGVGSVDDMALSINNGSIVIARNSSSYWRSSAEICGQIASMIDQQVR